MLSKNFYMRPNVKEILSDRFLRKWIIKYDQYDWLIIILLIYQNVIYLNIKNNFYIGILF